MVGLGLLIGLAAWTPASATAAPLTPPPGFRLPASDGYSIRVITYDGEELGRRDDVILLATRKGRAVFYSTEKGVTVDETTVSVDLGSLGSIDLHFAPNGKTHVEKSPCGGGQLEFQGGAYEGSIDFEGEEGYTEAHAVRVQAESRFLAELVCGESVDEGVGGHASGARLRVRRRWDGGRLELEATKNSPTRPSRFEATIEEERGALTIVRSIGMAAGAAAFDFDVPAQTALVSPPEPFSGSARFIHRGGRPGRLRGSLSVDFPGRSDVSLVGSRGSLVRWVRNPSHPFRIW